MNNNLFSTTLIKALSILDCFRDDRQEIGISDISAAIGMPVSSVHRLIQSLEFAGLLSQNLDSKKYSWGSKLLVLSKKCERYQLFEKVVVRYADQLGELTGETINVSVCNSGLVNHIYTKPSHFVLRPNFPLNTPFPSYSTSVGRVFLSHMNAATVEWFYEIYKDGIGMELSDFKAMLALFRQQGYATDDEAFSAGLRCVGAPVLLADGSVLFAISISAPVSRMDDERYRQAAALVVKYAGFISKDIQAME